MIYRKYSLLIHSYIPMAQKHFYITTTLPYVNANPHIGHALEFIQADVIARWNRGQWKEVFFNVWTDEHGLKILEKANEQWVPVQEFVDTNVETFTTFCERFSISYDSFYRTSNTNHHTVAQAFWKRCMQNWDIYKKKYSWLYCVWCEKFVTPKDLVDGKCPDHNKEPIEHNETNYFFGLSKYKEVLLDHLEKTQFVQPAHKINELRNFIEDLRDISVSRMRENLPWGIAVPWDDEQVMYVWFDALSNYVGAVWFPDAMDRLEQYRGSGESHNAIQLCGPDNLRFQWAIWQGMLASAWLALSKKILVHGMILWPDGNKMSKSIWNTIDPEEQLERYGAQAVRYYLIAWIPTFGNAAYIQEDLENFYNAHLANSFGNLLNRVINLAIKKWVSLDSSSASQEIVSYVQQKRQAIADAYESFDLYEAASVTHSVAIYANEYISRPGLEPWNKEVSVEQIEQTLNDCKALLEVVIEGYAPILPQACTKATTMLQQQTKWILFQKI